MANLCAIPLRKSYGQRRALHDFHSLFGTLCQETFAVGDGHQEIATRFLEGFGFGGLWGRGRGIAFWRERDFEVDYFRRGMTT